jgi:hypothetical protein
MGDLPRWKIEKMWSGRVIMGDLPRWKIKNVKWSHCNGWPTQMKDVMWQVWKMGLTWRSPEGMIEEGPENLVLLDNSWSQGLKTRCFLIARLIFSFLWDFPNNKVYLIFFPFQCLNHGSLLLSAQWFSPFFFSFFLVPNLAKLHWGFFLQQNKKYVQCFNVSWHACILTWFEI